MCVGQPTTTPRQSTDDLIVVPRSGGCREGRSHLKTEVHVVVQPSIFASLIEGLVGNLVSRFLLASDRMGPIKQRNTVDQKDSRRSIGQGGDMETDGQSIQALTTASDILALPVELIAPMGICPAHRVSEFGQVVKKPVNTAFRSGRDGCHKMHPTKRGRVGVPAATRQNANDAIAPPAMSTQREHSQRRACAI